MTFHLRIANTVMSRVMPQRVTPTMLHFSSHTPLIRFRHGKNVCTASNAHQPIDPGYPDTESVEFEFEFVQPIDTAAPKQPLLFSDDEIEAVLTGGASSGPAITVNRAIP